jgi:aconitate hydratase
MHMQSRDSFDSTTRLSVGGREYTIFSLERAVKGLGDVSRLPYCLKVLLENLLRHEDGERITESDIRTLADRRLDGSAQGEMVFHPTRVLMQDLTGVPAIVDLAAMRDTMEAAGGRAEWLDPSLPVDLIIDHSVSVDAFNRPDAYDINVRMEMQRNRERYAFLRWGQQAFRRFRVVPSGTGICHQVNLEHLGQVVQQMEQDGRRYAFPDTLVGTDSHTPMINGLGVLGWGVGGIEAEAAILGEPIGMRIPEVVGVRLTGALAPGATATDLVLRVTEILRAHGVVGKFVEFHGPGLQSLSLPDRATVSNMTPEYGATCGIFPIDEETLRYLRFSGRDQETVALVEAYARAQGMWHDPEATDTVYSERLELDLAEVQPSLAGPRRPQDRVSLSRLRENFDAFRGEEVPGDPVPPVAVAGEPYRLSHGDVVIAAITSCTNTSNPGVMLGAGLLARNAHRRGLKVKPWVKTSLAPGSRVVSDYLRDSGLQPELDALGFSLVGYGCTTCIGNSGPLAPAIVEAIEENDLCCLSVLSGNRNFEGRINPYTRGNYLCSPPLVVAYALAGTVRIDLQNEPLGEDSGGQPVYLHEIWPDAEEVQALIDATITPEMFRACYGEDLYSGPEVWRELIVKPGRTYEWEPESTYVRQPPFLAGMPQEPEPLSDVFDARPLAILGDSVTTDHISPAGAIPVDSAAGHYLQSKGIGPDRFNSYGSRRGNHEVMIRGTFANIRLRNRMAPGTRGGVTRYLPDDEEMSIYDAAMRYRKRKIPLVVIAGSEYGTGSSRDWAAKGTLLLGVRAVIAKSFERIHRSNLVGMGVLPLQFVEGQDAESLGIDRFSEFDLQGVGEIGPAGRISVIHKRQGEQVNRFELLCRIDTRDELRYLQHGGILPFVLRRVLREHR